jgi:hypothetical protein
VIAVKGGLLGIVKVAPGENGPWSDLRSVWLAG